MRRLIIDASVAAAFQITSQRTPASLALLSDWADHDAIAPYVYDLEVPWLLLKHERRSREPGFARGALSDLTHLGVTIEPAPAPEDLMLALEVAEKIGTGLYDAHYLLLALETGGALATRDHGLIRAAGLFGIEVLDVR